MDKKVLRKLSYGMYIIGCKDTKKAGCVVNTVVQITPDPTTIAVSIHHDNYTNEIIKKKKKFSVSILGEDTPSTLIGTFGYQTSREIDKYENVSYEEVEGVPVIKDTCGNLLCEVVQEVETSTHTIFIATVTAMLNYSDKKPMTYQYYQENLKGKSPKNAPTYAKEEDSNQKPKWRCKVCGYEVEMDVLPEDFKCPICGQPISAFEKMD